MHIKKPQWRAAFLWFGALALAACDEGTLSPRQTPMGDEADVVLEVSSAHARAGNRVAVAIRAETFGTRAIGALQGRLTFDAARLRYEGQIEDDAFVLVNDTRAGELRVVATDVDGFSDRVATFVFEVLRDGYADGLAYVSEELADVSVSLMRPTVLPGPRVARDLVPTAFAEAQRLSLADWKQRLDPQSDWNPGDPLFTPGQYRLNLVYGDANLSGGLSGSDALAVAQVAVGLREMIVGSDSPTLDAVVAGNVAPANLPGLGEPGDAVPPGENSGGTRTLSGSDVLAIRQEIVGLNPAIVGDLIPGRGPLATNRINVPAGDITTNTTWTANNVYELQGIVRVTGGATLTIEAGTRVESVGLQAGGVLGALFVARDGMINASGTALQPIVFTCAGTEPKPKGCWGGVWIAGNARLNEGDAALGSNPANGSRSVAGCNQRAGEATNPQLLYGGCNDDDNSGVLRYLVIEYAGWTFAPDVELNCLTLGAIGRGTAIDHIQCHAGQDDGIELFGGTVNLKHLYLTANSDDSFDISYGWSGSAQFIVMQHDPNDAEKGLEADNTEASASFGNTPRTNGQMWNVTFIGASSGTGTNASNDAIHVRRGTGPFLSNWLVANARRGMDLDDAATCVDIGTAGALNVRNSLFANVADLGNGDTDPNPCGAYAQATELEEAIITDAANSNTVSASAASAIMIAPTAFRLPDFRPQPGQGTGGAAPPNNGFLDGTATYVGAVAPASATRNNAPWYAGWTRGWFSDTQP